MHLLVRMRQVVQPIIMVVIITAIVAKGRSNLPLKSLPAGTTTGRLVFLFAMEIVYDSHIHVGQFYNIYTSPTELSVFLETVGVSRFAVSSTTICIGYYDLVLEEIRTLKNICGNRILSVLWIIPQMLEDGGLKMFLESDIQWRCLKIHPQLHPKAWINGSRKIKYVTQLAKDMRVPLLIHTGEMPGCNPSLFEKTIAANSDATFILAHGRPISETIKLMKRYPNVWTDTAFMPTENISLLCKEKLSDRVLWGTDYPIPKYHFPDDDMKTYYLNLVNQLKESVSETDFEKITHCNFEKIFSS